MLNVRCWMSYSLKSYVHKFLNLVGASAGQDDAKFLFIRGGYFQLLALIEVMAIFNEEDIKLLAHKQVMMMTNEEYVFPPILYIRLIIYSPPQTTLS